MYNGNPLRHNDDLRRHPVVILLEVVNDAAPLLLSQYDWHFNQLENQPYFST